MNLIKKIIAPFLVFFVILFVALELFSFALSKAELLLFNEVPAFYRGKDTAQSVLYWRTEKEAWGAWHKANSKAKETRSCFNVEYFSNEVGARDSSFNVQKIKKRYILLGDSFAEGFGVNAEDNAQSLIEKKTGVEIFNFGTAGDFGPLQYSFIYEQLAKRYAHDGVIIFFLPFNDFTDNDYDYWKEDGSTYLSANPPVERFRPYYQKVGFDKFLTFVPKDAKKRDSFFDTASNGALKKFLVDHFWLTNSIRTLKTIATSILKSKQKNQNYSGYFDPTVAQQEAAMHFIKNIINQEDGDITFVAVPIPSDFRRLNIGASRSDMLWWRSLKDIEKKSKGRFKFIDLIDYQPNVISDLYLPCDGHWNPAGNKWAADIISENLRK